MKTSHLGLIFTAIVLYFILLPGIPQDEAYHNFADQRFVLCCQNSWDVLSNLPFIFFGLAGILYTLKRPYSSDEKLYLLTFFGGAILVGLGSGYYHLTPNSQTLVWDRLPMTISFMSLVCLIMHITGMPDRAKQLFPYLLIIGIASVIYWAYTNDLKPYILVQFVPMLWIPWTISKNKSAVTPYLWKLILFYVIAKAFEMSDKMIYQISSELVSGHTIKHLSASLAILMIVLIVKNNSSTLTGSRD